MHEIQCNKFEANMQTSGKFVN